jgi:hypothetical protein
MFSSEILNTKALNHPFAKHLYDCVALKRNAMTSSRFQAALELQPTPYKKTLTATVHTLLQLQHSDCSLCQGYPFTKHLCYCVALTQRAQSRNKINFNRKQTCLNKPKKIF